MGARRHRRAEDCEQAAACGAVVALKLMISRNVGRALVPVLGPFISQHVPPLNQPHRFYQANPHGDYPAPPTTSRGIPPAAPGRTRTRALQLVSTRSLPESLGAVSDWLQPIALNTQVFCLTVRACNPSQPTQLVASTHEKQESILIVVS